jgi:hypothetical protein
VTGDITVVIPSIPPRTRMLRSALWSVLQQDHPATAVVVEMDAGRTGAGPTKNRGIAKVTTTWTAMLDDDDVFLPTHLGVLVQAAEAANVDVVYSIPSMNGGTGTDQHGRYGKPFDPAVLRQRSYIPTTSLFRTKVLQGTTGFCAPPGSLYDDWGCYLALLDAGARFLHVPEVTWVWNVWGGNTSGQPTRW